MRTYLLRIGLIVSASFGIASIFALVYNSAHRPSGPALAIIDLADREVIAEPDGESVEAIYYITNRGGNDLTFGKINTSCGCSSVKVNRSMLKPAQTASVRVEGRPPKSGKKTVEIDIESNAHNGPIILHLTMVGNARPPYVAGSSASVQFGDVMIGSEEHFFVQCMEMADTKPIFDKIQCSSQNMQIDGGFDVEVPSVPGRVIRTYNYTVKLISQVGHFGDFDEEIVIGSQSSSVGLQCRISVHGRTLPPVRSQPAAVFASFDDDSSSIAVVLTFVPFESSFPLRVTAPSTLPPGLVIDQLGSDGNRVKFQVNLNKRVRHSISDVIDFATNHPKLPVVKIPVNIKYTGK